jgi:glycosyltransferase involved in cell wall biosynthesis
MLKSPGYDTGAYAGMTLHISFNNNSIQGPYGGGNQFATSLEKYLTAQGHTVYRELRPDLDVIMMLNAKWNPQTTAYAPHDIAAYIQRYPGTAVIHRVNTCDEQRGARLGDNEAILKANPMADETVFVSDFIRQLFASQGWQTKNPWHVIHNAADTDIFSPALENTWRPGQKMRIVTHHWSANFLKGFDYYERLDYLLDTSPYRDDFELTFIGNLPFGYRLRNARCLPPMDSEKVAHELRQHHIYVSGARHEPAGNHYIEAMACGLPVLFLESGSLPEYCHDAGLGFTPITFESQLLAMRDQYADLRQKVLGYSWTAEKMGAQYHQLIQETVTRKRTAAYTAPSASVRLRYALRQYRQHMRRSLAAKQR